MTNKIKKENDLLYLVQAHERTWGEETYPNRPDLAAILGAAVVVFWEHAGEDKRLSISLHENLSELEQYLVRDILRLNFAMPQKRIVRIFENGKRMIIRRVQVQFEPAPDE